MNQKIVLPTINEEKRFEIKNLSDKPIVVESSGKKNVTLKPNEKRVFYINEKRVFYINRKRYFMRLLVDFLIRIVSIVVLSLGVSYLTGLGTFSAVLFTTGVWFLTVRLNNSAWPRLR